MDKGRRDREREVRAVLSENISVHTYYDQFLFPQKMSPWKLTNCKVFTVFRKKCEKYSNVRSTFPEATVMPESNLLTEASVLPSLQDLGSPQSLTPIQLFL